MGIPRTASSNVLPGKVRSSNTPNTAYAMACDGGLEVQRFTSLMPTLKCGMPRLRMAVWPGSAGGSMQNFSTNAGDMRAVVEKPHHDQLYVSADGRRLREAVQSCNTHGWVQDGTLLMPGHFFVDAVKTRLGLVSTRLVFYIFVLAPPPLICVIPNCGTTVGDDDNDDTATTL